MQRAIVECEGNLDAEAANNRIRFGIGAFLATLGIVVVLRKLHAPLWARGFLIVPFYVAMLSFLQGVKRT